MENLPAYIPVVFILTTLLTLLLLYKAAHRSKTVLIVLLAWLTFQAFAGLSGFYTFTAGVPPRFTLLLLPPVLLIAALFLIPKGRKFVDQLDVKTLTLLHVIRIPVELVLYWLFLHKTVPEIMTFEGRNFDILCGLSAPLVYYFGYVKQILKPKILLAWNIICLLVLANIIVTAVLSAPFDFQQFAFDQPNIALLYFPFVWLPACLVPVVLFSHLVSVRSLLRKKQSPL